MNKAQGDFRVEPASCLERIPPLTKDVTDGLLLQTAQLSLARNEHEALQLVMLADDEPIQDVSITVTNLRRAGANAPTTADLIKASDVSIRRVEYVRGNYKRPAPEWDAITYDDPSAGNGRLSFWPDVLREIKEPFSVAAGEAQPLWIDVYASAKTKPGTYTGEVHIQSDGQTRVVVPLQVDVWDFQLPQKNHLRSAFYIWNESLVSHYGFSGHRDPNFVEMRRKYVDFYLKHRVSPFTPADYSVDMKFTRRADGEIEIDFSEFDRQMQHAFDLGLNAFQWPGHMLLYPERQSLYTGGPYIWDETAKKYVWVEMNGNWAKPDAEQRELAASLSRKIADHLQEKGWLDKCVAYMVGEPLKGHDEHVPGLDDYEYARQIFSWLHEVHPGIRTMTAVLHDQYSPEIGADVDVWAADASNAAKFTDREKTEREKGRELWAYLPSLYRIDNFSATYRVGPWACFKYGLQGFGPFTDITAWPGVVGDPLSPESHTTANIPDGWITYPDKDGPVDTIRFQLLRDGMEDYEYLWLLQDMTKKLRQVEPQSPLLPQAERLLGLRTLIRDRDPFKKGGWDYSTEGILVERKKIGSICQEIQKALAKVVQ